MNLTKFLENIPLEFIKINNGNTIFTGNKENQVLILIIKPQIDNKNIDINKFANFNITFDNDRYFKFEGVTNINLNNEVTIIYPATEADIRKYGKTISKKIIETPEIYQTQVYPKIVNQDLTWISNIFEKKFEITNILYDDEYFVLLPDMKWDNKNMDQIYCLAILKDSNIRSIRDLNDKHIDFLKHIDDVSKRIIGETYMGSSTAGFDKLRSYFHYRPSFWHAHIHFNLINNNIGGASIDAAHTVHNVITNIRIKSDYYQIADLEVIDKEIFDFNL